MISAAELDHRTHSFSWVTFYSRSFMVMVPVLLLLVHEPSSFKESYSALSTTLAVLSERSQVAAWSCISLRIAFCSLTVCFCFVCSCIDVRCHRMMQTTTQRIAYAPVHRKPSYIKTRILLFRAGHRWKLGGPYFYCREEESSSVMCYIPLEHPKHSDNM